MLRKSVIWTFIMLQCSACTFEFDSQEFIVNDIEQELTEKYDSLKNVTVFNDDVSLQKKITFTKQVVFETGVGEVLRGIGSFEIDKDNYVYISNRKSIAVFDEDGSFIKRIGREGRGPGEFDNMTTLKPEYYSDKLLVYDDVLKRVTIFSTKTLSYLNSFSIDNHEINKIRGLRLSHLKSIHPYNDSLLVAEFEGLPNEERERTLYKRYYLINFNSEIVSTEIFNFSLNPNNTQAFFESTRNNFFPFPNPSDRYTHIDFDSHNNLYVTKTEDFLIKVYSPQGEYKRAIYYPIENRSLNREQIIEYFSYNKNSYERAKEFDFPETWPTIDQFFLDDEDRIWVSTITEDENYYEWWILENNGKLLTKFKWAGERLRRHHRFRVPPKVRNGYFYDVDEDSLGEKILIKYQIKLN